MNVDEEQIYKEFPPFGFIGNPLSRVYCTCIINIHALSLLLVCTNQYIDVNLLGQMQN